MKTAVDRRSGVSRTWDVGAPVDVALADEHRAAGSDELDVGDVPVRSGADVRAPRRDVPGPRTRVDRVPAGAGPALPRPGAQAGGPARHVRALAVDPGRALLLAVARLGVRQERRDERDGEDGEEAEHAERAAGARPGDREPHDADRTRRAPRHRAARVPGPGCRAVGEADRAGHGLPHTPAALGRGSPAPERRSPRRSRDL